VGQRCIDITGFNGNPDLSFTVEILKGPHIVEPVGQLDQDDSNIPRHGQQHFSEVLDLLLLQRFIFNRADFGDTINQRSNLLAELSLYFIEGDLGIFDNIMQYSRGNGVRVQMQLGQDKSDIQAVFDKPLPRFALLPLMRDIGEFISPP